MRKVMACSDRLDKPSCEHEIKVGSRILVDCVYVPGGDGPFRTVQIVIGDEVFSLARDPIPIEKDATVKVIVPFECFAVYLSGVEPEECDICLKQQFDGLVTKDSGMSVRDALGIGKGGK